MWRETYCWWFLGHACALLALVTPATLLGCLKELVKDRFQAVVWMHMGVNSACTQLR
jgi:hypothetical protein